MKETLEQIAENAEITKYMREETILVHSSSFTNNSCEARVIVTIDLPDGRTMQCDKVIRLRFVESKD